ncbi:hypothetical protein RKD23_001052 [Streptomyces sp. SAI-170]|uniref:hypothetical protein n=1 Tax=Streptomyces sp. SAI-170 TaxID=3377729 RepID=UPI003C7BED12
MFYRIRRRAQEPSERQRQHYEAHVRLVGQVPPEVQQVRAAHQSAPEPTSVVDDVLPPELRVPSHDQLDGRVMPWTQPIVLDGDMVACAECGAYRDWVIISTQGQIWVRCRQGHMQPETRLDTAWYNRHAGPADATHATFEDCLRHLGH